MFLTSLRRHSEPTSRPATAHPVHTELGKSMKPSYKEKCSSQLKASIEIQGTKRNVHLNEKLLSKSKGTKEMFISTKSFYRNPRVPKKCSSQRKASIEIQGTKRNVHLNEKLLLKSKGTKDPRGKTVLRYSKKKTLTLHQSATATLVVFQ